MGIKFTCPACGGALNVKSELAGKRGRCPKCQAKITIPVEGSEGGQASEGSAQAGTESQFIPETAVSPKVANPASAASGAATAPALAGSFVSAEQPAVSPVAVPAAVAVAAGGADPIAEAPTMQWYAVPPGAASQYGPASGEEFRVWMQEGRITADALVWRQDWADWKRAGAVFPQLEAPAVAGGPVVAPLAAAVATPLPTAVAAMPMAVGGPPVAQAAFPAVDAAPGTFMTAAPVAAEGFPVTADEPARARSSARGRHYRPRSNTGPIIAIVVLLLAMVPLSILLWKVLSENFGSAPTAETATGSKEGKE
jgi:hypothetical protein